MSSPSISKIMVYRYGLVFYVKGSTGQEYIVDYNIHKGWVCDCLDHIFRQRFCKHMKLCRDYVKEVFDVDMPSDVWCDNPKADMVFDDSQEVEV